MRQRQRRRKAERRRQTERRPTTRQLAAGATIAMGASLAATGSAQAATFTVSNLGDSGSGSLRQAILDANQNGGGSDDIVFASGLTGTIDVGASGRGLYPESAMNIQGPGADRITLRGVNNIDYLVFTGPAGAYGANPGDPITISGLTITGGNATNNNFGTNGGGIYNLNANLTISNAVITGNHADGDGGGIFTRDYPVTIVNSTISGNNASPASVGSYAGAIFSKYSDVTIRNSTIAGNQSGGDGGAVYMASGSGSGGSLSVENSTVANNASLAHGGDDEGGGLWIADFGGTGHSRLDIKSSTITGNSVGGGNGLGGGVYARLPGSRVSIQNTIVANNTGTTGNDLYLTQGGQVGFSLLKDPSNAVPPPYSITSTGPNITGVDPQLGPLANNGGLTQTQALGPASPGTDKGASLGLTSDQRGVLRPIDFPSIPNAAGGNGADIGAFELQPDNAFKLGKLKRNTKKGTAKQVVILPLPDAGSVTVAGKGLKTKTRSVADNGMVKLPVIPKGKKRAQENRSGMAKIKAKITYTPTGNVAKTLKRKLKLLKRT